MAEKTDFEKDLEELEDLEEDTFEEALDDTDKINFEKGVKELEEWFKENPKLPEEIEHILLRRFLQCMNGNVEDTKKIMELNYSMRNKNPNMFMNRDPEDESSKKMRAAGDFAPLPGLTPEGRKIIFFRMGDLNPKAVNSLEECKVFYMLSDCRFSMSDDEENPDAHHSLSTGDIQIVDMKGFTLAHAARASFSVTRVHMKYIQEAYPVRLHSMHVINCPSYMDKMLAVVKPFFKEEVFKMLHLHTDGMGDLLDHVPQEMLPDEYGGKAGSLLDLKDKWTEIINKKRDYLMDQKHWKVEQPKSRSWF